MANTRNPAATHSLPLLMNLIVKRAVATKAPAYLYRLPLARFAGVGYNWRCGDAMSAVPAVAIFGSAMGLRQLGGALHGALDVRDQRGAAPHQEESIDDSQR